MLCMSNQDGTWMISDHMHAIVYNFVPDNHDNPIKVKRNYT
jgi:hypothetical protein